MSDPRARPLAPAEEQQFQTDMQTDPTYVDWQRKFYGRFGEKLNLDSPDYDTRTAWRHGVKPELYAPDGLYHWPSGIQPAPYAKDLMLKAPDHPTMWMQRFFEQNNGADPNTVSREQLTKMLTPMLSEDMRQPNNVADMFLPKLTP